MSAPDNQISQRSRRAILARLQRKQQQVSRSESTPQAGPHPVMHKDLNIQFAERVRASSAKLVFASSIQQLPELIQEELDRLGLAGPVVTGSDPALSVLNTRPSGALPEFVSRHFGEADQVALSHALAGIAETGSLALASGAENPVTLNYRPDLHIIAVSENKLLKTLDDLWPQLRQQAADTRWPRSIHLVTGPSRTADVEQTIQIGAHGPRHVLVIQYRTPLTQGLEAVTDRL